MKGLETIGNAVDRFVGVFSPKSALKRQFYRKRLKHTRSSKYAAAKTDRMTGAWTTLNSGVNDVIRSSNSAVRARVRQLVRDFPYFKRACQILCDYTVGPGIMFQSRLKSPDGKLNKKKNQQVEDAFNFWADEADISGKLHYYEMMGLTKRQDIESGEFLAVQVYSKDPKRYLPYALQIFETDWLSDNPAPKTKIPKNREFDQGLEYKKSTGEVVAYHFTDPDSWGNAKRIKSEDVIHRFETLRPGQLRGISPFASAILIAHDLGEYIDATIDTAKMASKYLAFVSTPNPLDRQTNVETDSETGKKIDEIENAIVEYLMPGEEVNFAKSNTVSDTFDPFTRFILTMVAVATNCPFELLSGEYKGFSYSTGRLSRNDFSQQLRPGVIRQVRHFAMPTVRPFYDYSVIGGKISLPGYFTNPARYIQTEWQPPGMEAVDPLRETKSRIDEIKNLTRSPQEVIKARGRDPEAILKETAAFIQMAEDEGLGDIIDIMFGKTSTALANNPKAVEGQKSIRAIK